MAQNFPLTSINPAIKTGTDLATDLENFSETFRTMMSGEARPEGLVEGLWLKTNSDGTAEVMYSKASDQKDLSLFQIQSGTNGVQLLDRVLLSSANINDLANVEVVDPKAGEYLKYDGQKWISEPPVPIGTVNAFAGETAPTGWFICDGSSIAGRGYTQLETVLGSTTLPDLRGEFIRGLDSGRGVDANRNRLSWQGDELKAHEHFTLSGDSFSGTIKSVYYGMWRFTNHNGLLYEIQGSSEVADRARTSPTGGIETRPRNVALNYIIKHD